MDIENSSVEGIYLGGMDAFGSANQPKNDAIIGDCKWNCEGNGARLHNSRSRVRVRACIFCKSLG